MVEFEAKECLSKFNEIGLGYRSRFDYNWPKVIHTGIVGDMYRICHRHDVIYSYERELFPSSYESVLNSVVDLYISLFHHRSGSSYTPNFELSCFMIGEKYRVMIEGEGYKYFGEGFSRLSASFELYRILSEEHREEFMPGLQDLNFAEENDCFIDSFDRSSVTLNGLSQLRGMELLPYVDESACALLLSHERIPEGHLGQIELREGVFELYWVSEKLDSDLIEGPGHYSLNVYEVGHYGPVFSHDLDSGLNDVELYIGDVNGEYDHYLYQEDPSLLKKSYRDNSSFLFEIGKNGEGS